MNENVTLNMSVQLKDIFYCSSLYLSTSKSIIFAKYCFTNVLQSKIVDSDSNFILIKPPRSYKPSTSYRSLDSAAAINSCIF